MYYYSFPLIAGILSACLFPSYMGKCWFFPKSANLQIWYYHHFSNIFQYYTSYPISINWSGHSIQKSKFCNFLSWPRIISKVDSKV